MTDCAPVCGGEVMGRLCQVYRAMRKILSVPSHDITLSFVLVLLPRFIAMTMSSKFEKGQKNRISFKSVSHGTLADSGVKQFPSTIQFKEITQLLPNTILVSNLSPAVDGFCLKS